MATEKRQFRMTAKNPVILIAFVLMGILALYVVVQLFFILRRTYKTETAISYTLADSVELNGVAVFEAVDVPGSGNLGYLVDDGERVTSGTVLAECYTDNTQGVLRERLDRLDRNIDLLSKSQNATGTELSMLTAQTSQSLYNLLDKLDTAAYSGIDTAVDDFLLAQNRLQVSTGQIGSFEATIGALQAEREEIAAQLSGLQTVTAATNGYFICAETAPTRWYNADELQEADPSALTAMLELEEKNPPSAAETAGQIITGFSWKFYAVCPLETAQRFEGLSTVNISVSGKQNTPLAAEVAEVVLDEEAGLGKIVLECATINANVLRFGVETARVDLHTYTGIRIDKTALHIVDGQRGVYAKYGNLQRFLKIKTLYEDDNYILVPEGGKLGTDNEVRLYDEIIVEGTKLQDGKLL